VVRCSQRDPRSGIVDHFVVNKGRMKGCWISSEHLDLSALVLELHTRRQRQINKRLERIRAKEKAEKEIIQKEKAKRAAEGARQAMEQAKEKARQKAISDQQKANRAAAARSLANQNSTARKSALLSAQPSNSNKPPSQLEIAQYNKDLRLALMQHEMDMRQLMQACLLSGIFPVPEGKMTAVRNKNLALLKTAAEGLRRCNVLSIKDDQLMALLAASEKGALESIVKSKGGISSSAGNRLPSASGSHLSSAPKASPPTAARVNAATEASTTRFSAQQYQHSMSAPSHQAQGSSAPATRRPQQNSGVGAGNFNAFSSTPSPQVISLNQSRNGKWIHRTTNTHDCSCYLHIRLLLLIAYWISVQMWSGVIVSMICVSSERKRKNPGSRIISHPLNKFPIVRAVFVRQPRTSSSILRMTFLTWTICSVAPQVLLLLRR
jgi:hypothetical protein